MRFITTRKRSLGQGNIFTPVCHSVHRGVPGPKGGCPAPGGVCLVPGGPGWGCLVWGGCLVGGVPSPGGLVGGCLVPGGLVRGAPGPGGRVPGGHNPPDGYCCGRYASYWNAFFCIIIPLVLCEYKTYCWKSSPPLGPRNPRIEYAMPLTCSSAPFFTSLRCSIVPSAGLVCKNIRLLELSECMPGGVRVRGEGGASRGGTE